MFKRMKRHLGAGILITAPVGITLYFAWAIINWVDNLVTGMIPAKYMPEFMVPGLGFVLVIVFLIIIGALTAGYIGKAFNSLTGFIMEKMPVLNNVYNTLKQIFETVFSQKGNSFKEVALIEYPMKNCWAVAFVTSDTSGELQEKLSKDNGEEYVNVFIPTTPNPTSGFLLFLPRNKIKILEMSIEEGVKLIISAGIMTPMSNKEKAVAKLERDAKKLARKTKPKRSYSLKKKTAKTK
jgi:uncharacterized membrane protein